MTLPDAHERVLAQRWYEAATEVQAACAALQELDTPITEAVAKVATHQEVHAVVTKALEAECYRAAAERVDKAWGRSLFIAAGSRLRRSSRRKQGAGAI